SWDISEERNLIDHGNAAVPFVISFASLSAHLTVAPFIPAFLTFQFVKVTASLGNVSNTISAPGRSSANDKKTVVPAPHQNKIRRPPPSETGRLACV
ncbi:MAG: hypothetical protein WAN56_09940, partial [Halobacteriota archaeon]